MYRMFFMLLLSDTPFTAPATTLDEVSAMSIISLRYCRGPDLYFVHCDCLLHCCTTFISTCNCFTCHNGYENCACYDLTLVISSKENSETVSHV